MIFDPVDPPLTPTEQIWQHLTAEIMLSRELAVLNKMLDVAEVDRKQLKSELAATDEVAKNMIQRMREQVIHEQQRAKAIQEEARSRIASVCKSTDEQQALRQSQIEGFKKDVVTLRKKQTALEQELEASKKMLRRDEQTAMLANLSAKNRDLEQAVENLRTTIAALGNETRQAQTRANQAERLLAQAKNEHQQELANLRAGKYYRQEDIDKLKAESLQWQERALECGWIDPAEAINKIATVRTKVIEDAKKNGEKLTDSEVDARVDIATRFSNLEL